MRFVHAVKLEPEDGAQFTVRFRQFPQAITFGIDRADALIQAADCLEEAVAAMITDGENIPVAPDRPKRGEIMIPLAARMAAKAALYIAIRESGESISQLARRRKPDEKDIRRCLDPRHQTKISRMQKVVEALGKQLVLTMEDAA
jgi:antitoxin HicB